jgi:hypothetical protein
MIFSKNDQCFLRWMQAMMVHFCDETMFFPWVPFIQMHMVINISLNLLIGIWILTKNFIMNNIVLLFIDIKFIY